MNIELTKTAAQFSEGGREAGLLVLDDPFKPYIHPLRTPDGHVVTVAMPADHRHHKGLMYALRSADLNFWEEGRDAGTGIQEIISTAADGDVIALEILWRGYDGGLETYRETRQISCRLAPERRAFVWTWTSERTALRAHRLIKSQWSADHPDGRKINYHGLGIRLPWAWAFEAFPAAGVLGDGKPSDVVDVLGTNGPSAGLWGRIDGLWTPPITSVTIRQRHGFGWCVFRAGFAYLSTGPSTLAERDVAAGETFSESYEIEVADLDGPPAA